MVESKMFVYTFCIFNSNQLMLDNVYYLFIFSYLHRSHCIDVKIIWKSVEVNRKQD